MKKSNVTLPISAATQALALLMISCGGGSGDSFDTDIVDFTTVGAEVDPDGNTPLVVETSGMAGEMVLNTTPVVAIGDVHTVEIENVVFTSLPDASVDSARASVLLGRNLFGIQFCRVIRMLPAVRVICLSLATLMVFSVLLEQVVSVPDLIECPVRWG